MSATSGKWPTLWFGNTVNRLMIASPVPSHSSGLAFVAQRKLWLADTGDAVVLPSPVEEQFASYVAATTGVAAVRFVPSGDPIAPLGEPSRAAPPHLEAFLHQNAPTVNAYALNESVLRFCQRHALRVAGYDTPPDASLLQMISALNTKTGFRRLAVQLGLRTPAGREVSGEHELAQAIAEILISHQTAIVKLDRSSNGFGHWLVERAPAGLIAEGCRHYVRTHAAQGGSFVVEAFVPFTSVPSVEALVSSEGIEVAYLCDQRYTGVTFSGMSCPPQGLPNEARQELEAAALSIGGVLRRNGYRGYFDVDAGITANGQLFLTECNVRRTAGTWIHELLDRLVGKDERGKRAWVADARSVNGVLSFTDLLRVVDIAGTAWSARSGRGILFPAYTLPVDNKLRYLAIGRDFEEAEALETQLLDGVERCSVAELRPAIS